jgi:hypothetical protein
MIAISFTLGLRELPATATAWHLCTVFIPRRTITGRLARGQVWRRYDGRHWTQGVLRSISRVSEIRSPSDLPVFMPAEGDVMYGGRIQ